MIDVMEQSNRLFFQKYLGVCRLAEGRTHRRIDIIVAPLEQKATALLYFTGTLFEFTVTVMRNHKTEFNKF